MVQKHLHKLSYTAIALGFITVLTLAVLWLYPWKAIDIYVQPYKVLTPEVFVDEFVKYEIDYCRYTDADSLVLHQLVSDDGIKFRIDDEYQLRSAGIRLNEGCGLVIKAVHIPTYVDAGTYWIEEAVSYQVNPLHTSSYTFITEPFVVK